MTRRTLPAVLLGARLPHPHRMHHDDTGDNDVAFDPEPFYDDASALYDDYCHAIFGTPDELAAVRALRDHLNTYPGIDDDKPADADLWKLRAAYVDVLAELDYRIGAEGTIAKAARALVAALDAARNQVTP